MTGSGAADRESTAISIQLPFCDNSHVFTGRWRPRTGFQCRALPL